MGDPQALPKGCGIQTRSRTTGAILRGATANQANACMAWKWKPTLRLPPIPVHKRPRLGRALQARTARPEGRPSGPKRPLRAEGLFLAHKATQARTSACRPRGRSASMAITKPFDSIRTSKKLICENGTESDGFRTVFGHDFVGDVSGEMATFGKSDRIGRFSDGFRTIFGHVIPMGRERSVTRTTADTTRRLPCFEGDALHRRRRILRCEMYAA